MSALTWYNSVVDGMQIVTPEPLSTAGQALNNNFKKVMPTLSVIDPATSDDNTQGFGVGSLWINTTTMGQWICSNATLGNAVWQQLGIILLPTNTATSGNHNVFSITPTYNQTFGSAANTDFLINRTDTAVGSGAQNLIDCQISGVSKFKLDINGNIAFSGTATSNGTLLENTANKNHVNGYAGLDANGSLSGISVLMTTGTDATLAATALKLGQIAQATDKPISRFGDGTTAGGQFALVGGIFNEGNNRISYPSAYQFNYSNCTLFAGSIYDPTEVVQVHLSNGSNGTFEISTIGSGTSFQQPTLYISGADVYMGDCQGNTAVNFNNRQLVSSYGGTIAFDWSKSQLGRVGFAVTNFATVGGVIFDHYADASNTGTSETTLYNDTLPANVPAVGCKIIASYGILLANNSNNKEVKVYLGTTVLFDSGIMTTSGSGYMKIDLIIVNDGTTTSGLPNLRYAVSSSSAGTSAGNIASVGKIAGISLSSLGIKITGTGGSTTDVTATMATIFYYPHAQLT